ncbi:MAG TPA: CoA-binding protein [Caulobacteraceae bacterium]|nr:CoA-binding protein [Caulobacteraceae bacterium]
MSVVAASAAAVPDLERLLRPKSIAVVGASNRMPSIGGYVTANVIRAFRGGRIFPVNPREERVQGLQAWPDIAALPPDVDLAIIVIPSRGVPEALEACAERGIGGAVIITSGFAEVGGAGVELQSEVARILRRSGMRAIGPNCIGYMNLADGVMANFTLDPDDPLPAGGPVALVSQSGGLGGYMVRKALTAGLNLGWFVSTGNEVDVTVAATLRALVERDDVTVLLGAFEALRDPALFVETALRAAELGKPFVALKAGRSAEAAAAAFAHTASVAGSAAAFDAVCRQYGVFSVGSLEEMLDLGVIFQGGRRARGRRVGIVTGSGGAGVVLTDACVLEGLETPTLPAADQAALMALMPQPFMGSLANPVDVTAQALATPGVIDSVLAGVSASPAADMVIPVIIGNPTHPEMYIAAHRATEKPVAFVSTLPPTNLLDAGVPAFTDPRRAARALAALAEFSLRAPPVRQTRALDPRRRELARAVLSHRGPDGALPEDQARALLALYGSPSASVDRMDGRSATLTARCALHRDDGFGPMVVVEPGATGAPVMAQIPASAPDLAAAIAQGARPTPSAADAETLAHIAVALGDAALELPELTAIEVAGLRLAKGAILAAEVRLALAAPAEAGVVA